MLEVGDDRFASHDRSKNAANEKKSRQTAKNIGQPRDTESSANGTDIDENERRENEGFDGTIATAHIFIEPVAHLEIADAVSRGTAQTLHEMGFCSGEVLFERIGAAEVQGDGGFDPFA